MTQQTTAIAMSGGADSLFTLVLMKEKGEKVVALHARFIDVEEGKDPVPKLEKVCAEHGVELHVVDCREAFEEKVVKPFVAEYQAGRTPNPCARCNASMKFGLLMDAAEKIGAERIATGHYAKVVERDKGSVALMKGVDPVKDQSYFLSLVPQERLAKVSMPLGDWCKKDVYGELEKRGVTPPIPSESQEICFVPNDDYRAFLEARPEKLGSEGPVLFTDGKRIAKHTGLWKYTEGQRRGLGIAWSEPLYVIEKNMEKNTLMVGTKDALMVTACTAHEINMLVPFENWPQEVLVRTRYRQHASPARVEMLETSCHSDGKAHGATQEEPHGELKLMAHFHEPIQPPALGQVLAVFDTEGRVLAGGIISKNHAVA
ncbi:MAG: tRNA 2-thiouridine(34) synthase MnmA [Pseudomonadota bacterium]